MLSISKKPKTMRTRLSLNQKIEAYEKLSTGASNAHIMNEFQISSRTVTKLRKEGPMLKEIAEKAGRNLQSKTVRDPAFPEIDDNVCQFIDMARQANVPVTKDIIREKALLFRDEMLKKADLSPPARARWESFNASSGWCSKFTKRHAIVSITLHGQGASATVEEAAEDMDCSSNCCRKRTYVSRKENKKTIRGTKQMGAKDRVTAYLCANADGSGKVPIAIIGKAKNPRCFRLGRPPVAYFNNRTAWSDGATFQKWFTFVFLPFVQKKTTKKVALLVDNASSHSNLSNSQEQVSIIALPPNVTAVHQPMDLGIIAAWKKRYRREMLREIVKDIETRTARRELNKKNPGGMNGLAQGYAPHILDVANLAKHSWDGVSQNTIARCWVKANCLPVPMSAHINASFGKSGDVTSESCYGDLVSAFRDLKLSVEDSDPLVREVPDVVTEDDIGRWLTIEDDEEVQAAIVSDITDDISRLSCVPNETVPDVTESATETEEICLTISTKLPSLQDLYTKFRPVEKIAFEMNAPDASMHIKRGLQLLCDQIRKDNARPTRQLLITEIFRSE
eukprot:IDg5173t1